ncbi:hypothetical protein [Pilimelia columellifera]|uniref:Uncharacterized protein n=1 Tax=Pilimelia columellifera subsp. columellifera TaxID=706583 RepID=A0ABN3ND19_9ACTN
MAKSTKRIAVIAAASVAGVAIAGIAFAAWTSSSAGKGTVEAGTLAKVAVSDVAINGKLRPGAFAALSMKVANPADNGRMKVTSIALAEGGIRANAAAEAKGCTGAATGVVFHPEAMKTPLIVEAGTTGQLVLEKAIEMTNESVNSCQGATFSVPVVVTAESIAEDAPAPAPAAS